MTTERIAILFSRYMEGVATEAEGYELAALALMPRNTALIKQLEKEYWDEMKAAGASLTEHEIEWLMLNVPGKKEKTPLRYLWWQRIAIAASILLALTTTAYFLFFNKGKPENATVKTEGLAKDVKAPQTNRAMIALANGQIVYLDSVSNGQLAVQGNMTLVKLPNGEITYQKTKGDVAEAPQYNTLVNPRGSKVVDMVLSDGSHIWLNAGSSLTFPVVFTGKERKVSISGEAYFEVAHDASRPFLVNKDGMQVQVLGTHFNINAYDDEKEWKVTLLEGRVNVGKGADIKILHPGQQACVATAINVMDGVDVNEAIAWKNGYFSFTKADIQTVMRQLSRWYDIQPVFEGNGSNRQFSGEIDKKLTLAQVLEGLRLAKVNYKLENGNKVIIKL